MSDDSTLPSVLAFFLERCSIVGNSSEQPSPRLLACKATQGVQKRNQLQASSICEVASKLLSDPEVYNVKDSKFYSNGKFNRCMLLRLLQYWRPASYLYTWHASLWGPPQIALQITCTGPMPGPPLLCLALFLPHRCLPWPCSSSHLGCKR